MKNKKIVFIIPSLTPGGAERVVTTLANQLVRYYDVKIIQLYDFNPFYVLEKKVKLTYCRKLYHPKTNILKSLYNHIFMIRKISKILKNEDLVIGFTTTCNIYAVLSSKFVRIPSIISERIHPDFNNDSRFWNKVRNYVYPKANKIVLQTIGIKQYFSSIIKNENIEIINNPLNPDFYNHRNLNIEKENVILNVGRLDGQKNQELLINAFANIPNDNWKLSIIGEGDLRTHYQKLIHNLNMQDKIFLIGKTKSIYNAYNKASIFAFTSNYEGFPNALIEAMFFGLPCISTDCPTGPSELIKNLENGILIPIKDQKALEKALIELMTNKKLRNKLSKNALASLKDFNVNIVSRKWKTIIDNLIS